MNQPLVGFPIVLSLLWSAALGFAQEPVWHADHGFRWATLDVPPGGRTGFTLLTPEQTGIDFTNVLLEWSGATSRILYNGAGVALGDFDNDGRLDIFVCG